MMTATPARGAGIAALCAYGFVAGSLAWAMLA